jgi:anti-anti-sigma regulatory factor
MAFPAPAVVTEHTDDALVVSVSAGGLATATELYGELEEAVGAGERRVVVDLAAAPPLDLEVVGVLLASLRRLNDVDGSLVLLAPAGEPLAVTGDTVPLHDFFRVEHSLPAAIAATAVGVGS